MHTTPPYVELRTGVKGGLVAGAPHDREIPIRIEIPRNRGRKSAKMLGNKFGIRY
jgi:hypothetical protein